jgi:hypothetical protein
VAPVRALVSQPLDAAVALAQQRKAVSDARERARAGALAEAGDLLEAARYAHRNDPALVRLVADGYGMVGLDLLGQGRPEDARRFARQGLEADSLAPEPRMVLGDLAYASNDLEDAVLEWERGLTPNPAHAGLQSRIRKAQNELAIVQRYQTRRSEHFILTFEGEADQEVARFALQTLEEAYEKLGEFYGLKPTDMVPIVLYPRVGFDTLEKPAWSGGFFDGKVRVPTQGALDHQRDFRAKLAHEYGHAVFFRAVHGNAAPAWLNEGLAQVAESTMEPIPQTSCGFGHLAPLAALQQGFGRLSAREASAAYPTAKHAAERLVALQGLERMRLLLGFLGERQSMPEAFEHATGQRYADFVDAFDHEASGR